jgi:DNA invertase Pin-like site-specific DNA recombinase
MTKRVAIYARYSSDRQSEASAEDQARLCRERAEREGWAVVGAFLDEAVSGATRNRPQLTAMLARAAEFDIVLTESLDRLSRDQEDIHAIQKRLRFAGVEIVTLADGTVGEEILSVKGMMAALFLRDLGQKTRRGQMGRVHAGRIPGGISYGYRRVSRLDEKGEVERGLREIDEVQAEVVRRIFRQYLLGISPKEIARQLNAERIPAPRGTLWRASTITGHRTRRNGILYNALYAGRIQFNRQTFLRDPDTRRRVARPNPASEWLEHDVPELRIVEDAAWKAVQARLANGSTQPMHKRRRPKRLFSGLLECGSCGGSIIIVCGEQWGCGNHRETGTCANNRLTRNSVIEARVLGALKERLLDPALVSEYVAAYHAAEREAVAHHRESKAGLRRRHREVDARVKRLASAIADGADVAEVRDLLRQASEERDAVAAELDDLDACHVVTMHPRLADTYRKRIDQLSTALEGSSDARAEAKQALRGLVEKVVVIPKQDRGVDLELHGRLAEIISFAQNKKAPAEARADCTVKMVAGARSRLSRALSVVLA